MPETYFKDSIHIKNKASAVLMTVISLDSTLQKGIYWSQFLELVEQSFNEKKLSKLIIVTTGYLQRYYFSLGKEKLSEEEDIDKRSMELDQQWLNIHYPNKDKINLPVEIISWKDLLKLPKSPSFKEFHRCIINDYVKEKEFKHLVNKHAEGYVSRKFLQYCKDTHFDRNQLHQVAVDYVLEECAAIQQLFRCDADLLAYPHGMNPPANYVWNKYFKDEPLRYVRYKTKSWDLADNSSRHVQNGLFKLNNELSAQHYLTGYVDGSLRGKNWSLLQQCLFIRGIKQLIESVNAKEQPICPIRLTARKSI